MIGGYQIALAGVLYCVSYFLVTIPTFISLNPTAVNLSDLCVVWINMVRLNHFLCSIPFLFHISTQRFLSISTPLILNV